MPTNPNNYNYNGDVTHEMQEYGQRVSVDTPKNNNNIQQNYTQNNAQNMQSNAQYNNTQQQNIPIFKTQSNDSFHFQTNNNNMQNNDAQPQIVRQNTYDREMNEYQQQYENLYQRCVLLFL